MKIKALRSFITTAQGNFEAGEIKEVNDGYGRHLIEHGYAEQVKTAPTTEYKTKVEKTVPLDESSTEKPSGVSHQGRRSRKKTAKSSEGGESSPSTPASD